MATYLEILQDAAALSGTIDRRSISSVNATGRAGLLAQFIRDSWIEIQNQQRNWHFLIVPFPDNAEFTQANPGPYLPTTLNLTNPPWADWISGEASGSVPLSCWPPDSRTEELQMRFLRWPEFRQAYRFGSSLDGHTGQPSAFSIDPRDQLWVWPTPDQDYKVAGSYRREAQVLRNDADVPIIAADHHPALVWAAVLLLHRHDEAEPNVLVTTQQGLDQRMNAVRRRYLASPSLRFGALGRRQGRVRNLSPRSFGS